MKADTPVLKDIVLVGGGHAHVSVLRMFGMKPIPGVRLTLITRDIHTPYSGMLPGYVAGHYHYDEVHIDLGPLARFAGARLYHGEVDGIDPGERLVHVPGRPAVHYDLLSINTGSRPRTIDVPGALEHALPVKPIDRWLRDWEALQARVLDSRGDFRLLVVGGGAGGVELALSTRHRLSRLLHESGDQAPRQVAVAHRRQPIRVGQGRPQLDGVVQQRVPGHPIGPQEVERRIEHRDLDVLSLSGALTMQECRGHCLGHGQGGQLVHHRVADEARLAGLRIRLYGGKAGGRLQDVIEGGLLRPGTRDGGPARRNLLSVAHREKHS